MPASEYIKGLRRKIGHDLLLLPGVTAIVINQRDEILLQLRRDTHTWAPPSGALEPGENLAECAIREVREESGITIIPTSIIAVLSGAAYKSTYPNGDQISAVSTVFLCHPGSDNAPRVNDGESLEMRYFHPTALPQNILSRHQSIISLALEHNPRAAFNPPGDASHDDHFS